MSTIKVEIEASGFAFAFESFEKWIQGRPRIWKLHELKGTDAICIDANGKVCAYGSHFRNAVYPVSVYRLAHPDVRKLERAK